jgi:very-short-patch-repair endonuclease
VYLVVGTPWSWGQQMMAAVLAAGPGAVASHRAAARLWGLVDDAPIELTVPRGRTPELWGPVVVHQTTSPAYPLHRNRIAVTSPMRALLDLAAVASVATVLDAMDRAAVANLCQVAAIEWELLAVARPGRRGVRVLREALDVQALLDEPPEGMLEPRFARLAKRHGLPKAVFQHRVGRYRIDFAYLDVMLAIEVDGYGARSTRRRFQSDTDRQNALTNLGWTVLRFTWNDIVKRPDHVAKVIRPQLRRAHAGIPA